MSNKGFFKLKCQHVIGAVTLGAATYFGSHSYKGNSIWDPFVGVANVLPTGYQTLADNYRYYKVTACKIQFLVFSSNAKVTYCAVHGRAANQASITSIQEMLENREKPMSRYICKTLSAADAVGVFNSRAEITMYHRSKFMFGVLFQDPQQVGVFGSDPAQLWYYDVMYGCQNESATFYVETKLTYYVSVSEHKDVARIEV